MLQRKTTPLCSPQGTIRWGCVAEEEHPVGPAGDPLEMVVIRVWDVLEGRGEADGLLVETLHRPSGCQRGHQHDHKISSDGVSRRGGREGGDEASEAVSASSYCGCNYDRYEAS